jgi:GNAT superfamily N-acetyltransferase
MTAQTTELRELSTQDVLPVIRICNQTFFEHARFPETGVKILQYIKDYPRWQWGIFSAGSPLAFLLTQPYPEKKKVAIRLIAANPEKQSKGLGSRLLAHLTLKALEAGFNLLSVGTPFASSFYKKNGYQLKHTSLKVTRKIQGASIPKPTGFMVKPLNFDNAQLYLAKLSGQKNRADFLKAFLANVGKGSNLMLLLKHDGEFIGTVIGHRSDFHGDFTEVAYWHIHREKCNPAELTAAIEYTASCLGMGMVGFSAPEEMEEEFENLGYQRAALDYFWTMYTLEKPIA